MFERIFTWWNGSTFSTSLTLFRRGAVLIGKDEQGNRYFEEKSSNMPNGRLRRWVIYHGVAEASRVSPDWHGWLHHTFDEPPTAAPLTRQPWEKDHIPNMTGTPLAYHPAGSLAGAGGAANLEKDYQPWSPDEA